MFRMNFSPDRSRHTAWMLPARAVNSPSLGLLRSCVDRVWRHMMIAIVRDSAALLVRCSCAYPSAMPFPTCGGQAFQKGSAQ